MWQIKEAENVVNVFKKTTKKSTKYKIVRLQDFNDEFWSVCFTLQDLIAHSPVGLHKDIFMNKNILVFNMHRKH